MRKIFIVLMFCFCAFALTVSAQRPDPSGKGRYTLQPNNSIFNSIPEYKGPDSLEGLGLKTAAELGLTGEEFWNEYPKGPRLVKLHATAKIYYDTGSMQPYYLDGCIVNGKPRPNRLIAVKVVIEKEKIVEVEKEKIVEKRVEVPVDRIVKVDVPVDRPIVVCPAGYEFDKWKASQKSRLLGGKTQYALSMGGSMLATLLRKGKREDYIEGAIGTTALQRGQQYFNASQDEVYLVGPGIQPIKLKRGQDQQVGPGMDVVWEGDRAVLIATYQGQQYTCTDSVGRRGSNMGVWTSRTRTRDIIQQIPFCPNGTITSDGRCGTKTQTPGTTPTSPSQTNPGGIRTGNGPTNQPCRINPVTGQCYPPITSTPTPTTSTSTVPAGTGGVRPPITNNPPVVTNPPTGTMPPRICRPGQACIQNTNLTPSSVTTTNSSVSDLPRVTGIVRKN